jgi:hypothetical protein
MKATDAIKAFNSVLNISTDELKAKLTELRAVVQNLQSSTNIISFPEYKSIQEAVVALEVILKVRYGLSMPEAVKDYTELTLHRREASRRRGQERARRGLRLVRQRSRS